MKPTSMIFLVLALILVFGGFMTCNIAKSMAASQNIPLYDQEFDENGDAVYRYAIADDSVTKLNLVFSDIDVTVIGGAPSSYVELKNFNVTSYRTTLSGGTVTVNGTASLTSSLIDMSGGGIRFRGLRYFLLKKPAENSVRSATVYISKDAMLQTVSLTLTNGKAFFSGISNSIDYSVILTNADVLFDRVTTMSVANLNVTDGNVDMTSSRFVSVTANIKNGNFTLQGGNAIQNGTVSYDLSVADAGTIRYNGGAVGSSYKVTSAAPECLIKVNLQNGNIDVSDGGDPVIAELTDP